MSVATYSRRCVAETLGTALLLATVVGSGIMGDRLASGNVAVALLANSVATGAGLAVLILVFGPISGAHFNPAVTITSAALGQMPWRAAIGYLVAQVLGAFAGVAAAHLMFGGAILQASTHARADAGLVFSEAVATFGLLAVILGLARHRPSATPYAVGTYILSAYWFTSSTSFANPAVTLARAFTDTFTGIRLQDVPGFLAGQAIGAAVAVLLFRWFARGGGA